MNMGARRHVHTPGEEARHRCGLLAAALGSIALLLAACAGPTSSPSPSSPSPSPRTEGSAAPKVSTRPIDATQAARLQRVWTPLLAVMNHPLKPSDVQIGLMDDPHINAANAEQATEQISTAFTPGVTIVIADLTSAACRDRSAIRYLLKAHRKATARGRQVRFVIRPGGPLHRITEFADIHPLLAVYPTLRHAIQGRSATPPWRPRLDLRGSRS